MDEKRWSFAVVKASLCLTVAFLQGVVVVPFAAADAGPTTLAVAAQATSVPVRQLSDLHALEARVKASVKKALQATVSVQVGRGAKRGYAFGSGVIVSEDGYVLTAAHVSSLPDQDVTFRFADGQRAHGVTLGLHKELDMGLMKITDVGKWPHLQRAKSSSLATGDWVIATGHPGGFDQSGHALVRLGRILKKTSKVLLTDCTLIGGDSGGPLVDINGNVIGIHSRIGADLTTNLHVPIDRFAENWDRLAKKDVWGWMVNVKPWIGVEHNDAFSQARIRQVRSDSPAERAGMQSGDTIIRFADEPVGSFAQLKRLVARQTPGGKVEIQFRRDGVLFETTMDIAERTTTADSQTRDDADLLKDWLDQIDMRRSPGRAIVGIGKNADQVKESFHDALDAASRVTVEVLDAGNVVALGTIVEEDLILTKASQLRGLNIRCRFRGSRPFSVDLVSELRSHDLALLKSSRKLPTAKMPISKSPEPGDLLASSGLNVWPLAIGVASTGPTEIPSEGKLGIMMETNVPRISNIVAGSGADTAGLRVRDLITEVGDMPVTTSEELVVQIRKRFPGDVLQLAVNRNGETHKLAVELGRYSEFDEALAEFEDFLGGDLSDRRTGFARVLQHDTAIQPRHCGGPVVDAHGRFVGINIARAARTTSYLLPADEVKSALAELKTLQTDHLATVGVGGTNN